MPACCAIFMGEFFLRLSCSENKKYVWRHHWIDFITSIPVPGEAQLARFEGLVALPDFFGYLDFCVSSASSSFYGRGMDKFQDVLDIKLMKKTLKWGIISTILGAVLVYQVEGIPTAGDPLSGDSTTCHQALGRKVSKAKLLLVSQGNLVEFYHRINRRLWRHS